MSARTSWACDDLGVCQPASTPMYKRALPGAKQTDYVWLDLEGRLAHPCLLRSTSIVQTEEGYFALRELFRP